MLAMARGILGSKDRSWLVERNEFWKWLVIEAQREDRTPSVRQASIAMLAFAPESMSEANHVLKNLSEQLGAPKVSEGGLLRMAAFQAWSKRSDPSFAEWVVEHYPGAGPEFRQAMWQSLRSHPRRVETLIRAVEAERLSLSSFDAVQLQSIRDSTPTELRSIVDRWIDSRVDRDRQTVVDRYAQSLSTHFDPQRGKALFLQSCAPCHRVDGVGEAIGPDISDTRTQSTMQLLIAILDPHRTVDQNYFQTVVRLDDGGVIHGIVVEESARHLVLKNQQSPRLVIEKEAVETMISTGRSLMPDGLEVQIDASGMNDLIGYLKNWRYNRSEFQAIQE
jgi:putative heme-binding domain-containing protein